MSTNTYPIESPALMNPSPDTSPHRMARLAGVLYLVIIVAGIFAQMFVRSSLIVPGDASATAQNIIASEGLLRLSIAGDLVMIMSDIAIGLIFYVLLKPVNNTLALLATFFRLAQATALGINLLNLFLGIKLLGGAGFMGAFSQAQLNALALTFFEAHATGYTLSMVFFGLSILILGYLVFKSGYLPKVLGGMLVVAACGYLTDSFAQVLMVNYADYASIFSLVVFMPAFIAELAFGLWLLVKGVKARPATQAV
jgi:hypothetical protein